MDSSAFVKEFSEETGSEIAHRLFSDCEKGRIELVTSHWTIGESIAAVDRKFRKRELTEEQRDTIIVTLIGRTTELANKKHLTIVTLNQNFVTASWKYITSNHLSADDALHLVSYLVTECDIFAASDKYLVAVTKKEGIESYNIEDQKDMSKLSKMLEAGGPSRA